MLRSYQTVIAELARTTEQSRRNELLAELATVLEQTRRADNERFGLLFAALEEEMRATLARMEIELVTLRELDQKRELQRQQREIAQLQDLADRRQAINTKLHQLSNFIQAIDHKLNEQAELIHNYIFNNDANNTA